MVLQPTTTTQSAWLSALPRKLILTQADLDAFLDSPCCNQLVAFLLALNDSVQTPGATAGLTTTCCRPLSRVVHAVVEMLEALNSCIDQFPARDHANSRFGNRVFRDWLDRAETVAAGFIHDIVAADDCDEHRETSRIAFVPELLVYVMNSFGDRNRIDYGTGHELNFIVFLHCLQRLGLVSQGDYQALVLQVFAGGYMRLMRRLQTEYWLEPAGSHGVWGLDDYHFLPFLFGAAQLSGHKYIKPKAIHDKQLVAEYSADYIYLACVRFVDNVKTESLAWHSPMLNDISGVKLWSKVNSGLVKMFRTEVLGKLPIMQHFLFGRLCGGVDLDQLDGRQLEQFYRLVDSHCNWTSYVPPSGGVHSDTDCHHHHQHAPVIASPIVQLQSAENHDDNDPEAQVEVVVKYVRGPNGKDIPIKARRPLHDQLQQAAIVSDGPQELFAMGQQFPTCCGHRIPSAIAASAAGSPRRLPFD